MRGWTLGGVAVVALTACSSSGGVPAGSAGPPGAEAGIGSGPVASLSDAGWSSGDAGSFEPVPPPDAAVKAQTDAGGYPLCDGGVIPADRFVTQVVSFEAGGCAGFGESEMPGIVEGPPVGAGADQGSLDVLSLGNGGTIVLAFGPNAIVDGPGADFLVFENPFDVGGDPSHLYAEPGEVSVSDDGVSWTTFPCTATSAPYGACAGWHPVYSSPGSCVSPLDVASAGGDPFDLHDIGVASAKYVRIVDKIVEACPSNPAQAPNTDGFDLDAIAIVNAARAD